MFLSLHRYYVASISALCLLHIALSIAFLFPSSSSNGGWSTGGSNIARSSLSHRTQEYLNYIKGIYHHHNVPLSRHFLSTLQNKQLDPATQYDTIANELHNLSKQIHLQRKKKKIRSADQFSGYIQHLNQQIEKSKPLARELCKSILSSCASHPGKNGQPPSYIQCSSPSRLLQTLLALATLDMKCQITLLKLIGNRLKEGDFLGQFSGHDLSLTLWCYATLSRPHLGVLKSFMRRLRKKKVRKDMSPNSICRAVWATGKSVEQLDLIIQQFEYGLDNNQGAFNYTTRGKDFDDDVALLRHESETMCYTLLHELSKPINFTANTSTMTNINKSLVDTNPSTRISYLRAEQVADILCTCVIFEMNKDEKFIMDLCQHLMQDKLMNQCNAVTLSRILWSFQRLLYDEIEAISLLQRRFITLLGMYGSNVCSPKTLITILRSIVMMLPTVSIHNSHDMNALFQGVDIVLLSNKRYLSRCNEFEISNICWTMAKAKYYRKDTLYHISDRMMDRDILEACTPSSASRFLWSITTLTEEKVSIKESDEDMQELLFELFQSLGGIMLSSKLAPVDCAYAMWSMAKSSHALDMNVFDHLAKVLSCDFMLERATVQQVAIALWSCGKIYSWEDTAQEINKYGIAKTPSYVNNARAYGRFLACFSNKLSSKDIAQAIWALGRLKITDEAIITPLSSAASEMVQDGRFNSQEIANILWGLSKTGFKNATILQPFTKEIQTSYILDSCSSMNTQEAANILYALGKMKIKDEELFSCLSSVLMRQLAEVTPQTIANALWAHEITGLEPPMQLFNRWAMEKLNIAGFYTGNQTDLVKIKTIKE